MNCKIAWEISSLVCNARSLAKEQSCALDFLGATEHGYLQPLYKLTERLQVSQESRLTCSAQNGTAIPSALEEGKFSSLFSPLLLCQVWAQRKDERKEMNPLHHQNSSALSSTPGITSSTCSLSLSRLCFSF